MESTEWRRVRRFTKNCHSSSESSLLLSPCVWRKCTYATQANEDVFCTPLTCLGLHARREGGREGGREWERERGREGGRGREGAEGREGREGGREGQGGREGREGGGTHPLTLTNVCTVQGFLHDIIPILVLQQGQKNTVKKKQSSLANATHKNVIMVDTYLCIPQDLLRLTAETKSSELRKHMHHIFRKHF